MIVCQSSNKNSILQYCQIQGFLRVSSCYNSDVMLDTQRILLQPRYQILQLDVLINRDMAPLAAGQSESCCRTPQHLRLKRDNSRSRLGCLGSLGETLLPTHYLYCHTPSHSHVSSKMYIRIFVIFCHTCMQRHTVLSNACKCVICFAKVQIRICDSYIDPFLLCHDTYCVFGVCLLECPSRKEMILIIYYMWLFHVIYVYIFYNWYLHVLHKYVTIIGG